MTENDKDEIIRKKYYSDEIGFGSVASTWKEAHKQHPGITLQYVQEWMNKQNINKPNLNTVGKTLTLQIGRYNK